MFASESPDTLEVLLPLFLDALEVCPHLGVNGVFIFEGHLDAEGDGANRRF